MRYKRTNMSFHYGVPPTHYNKFYDSGYESQSPQSSGEYVHYMPYQYDYSTPVKGHRRQASHTPRSSRVGGWFSPAGSPPPGGDRYVYNVSPTKEAYVSYERKKATSSSKPTTKSQPRTVRKPSQPVHIYDGDDVYGRDHIVEDRIPARPPRPSKHGKKPSTDSYFYFGQEQIYEPPLPRGKMLLELVFPKATASRIGILLRSLSFFLAVSSMLMH